MGLVCENKGSLETFIKSENRDYSIFNDLTKRLKKFNKILFAEITIDSHKNFVLIITPDGIREGIIPTGEIVEAAPQIDGWEIKKFRQASDRMDLNFGGLKFGYEDIKIWRKFDIEAELVDVVVLIKGYDKNDQRYMSLGFLYLDHYLGEFNVLTRVGHIDFLGWDRMNDDAEYVDLLTLRNEIEDKLY